ncbi:hypothetical protein [Frankia sp. Cr1]|uniref:hypothetical protein n=1 Tax=Frankia sp. Cr1 TaxID=3073931 RepID=UPI002AD55E28|nr:hypothetical protein [Frankia sp. Cr1]
MPELLGSNYALDTLIVRGGMGSDLRGELTRRGTFTPADALTMTADVLRGVAAALP